MANLEATAGAEDGAEDGPNEEFFQRFGSSIQDDLGADEDPTKSDCLSSLSALERAAHEDTIRSLLEMFPSWSHGDMEAVLSACEFKLDVAAEEVMRLGAEAGPKEGSTELAVSFADGGPAVREWGAGVKELDLRTSISRGQLDDYERAVIEKLDDELEEGGGECEHLTVCLTVPKFGKPGESLRVTQLDGSQFLVRIPLSAAAPEAKFLAHFPCKPMREAARRHLAGGGDFLAMVRAAAEDTGASRGPRSEEDELAQALKQSIADSERARELEEEEETQLKHAMMKSEFGEDENEV